MLGSGKWWALPLLLCLLGLASVFHLCAANSRIDARQVFGSIQDAIDAAEPGASIHVPTGEYFEHLVISKPIALTGENWSTTILDGSGTGTLVEIRSDNVSLSGFTLRNAERALVINGVRNCTIEKNQITNVLLNWGIGIYATYCDNITIRQNYARSAYYHHIYFYYVENSKITDNELIANSRWNQPVFLSYSDQNTICRNQIRGERFQNEGGIGLLNSNYNVVSHNNVVENDWVGISLRKSNYTIVEGNTIIGHTFCGILLNLTNSNSVYLNNIIENTFQATIANSDNVSLTSGSFGNYWSDYSGTDANDDGIGDSPYLVDAENADHHPLMGQFCHHDIQRGNETFYVDVISNSTVNTLEYLNNETFPTGILFLNVSGYQTTKGFCLLIFPKTLIEPPYFVTVDGGDPILLKDLSDTQTATLHFVYFHENDQDRIEVVPELTSLLQLAAVLLLLPLAAFFVKSFKRHVK